MAIEFINPITAGTVLVRSDVRSQNYVAGSSGWIIEADGDAEFNSIVIRGGTVVSGKSLYYNGTPAAGNLVGSISATAGTDSFGNAYLAGFTVYDTSGSGLYTQMQPDGDLALGYSSVFANPGLLSAFAGGLMFTTPYTNSAPNDDPVVFTMLPGGTTGADRGYVQFSTNNGRDMSFNLYGPTVINTQETSSVGLTVDAVSGTTADLMRLRVNGDSKFTVDEEGNLTTYSDNSFATYTPTMTGEGTASFSTQTGWYQRVGKMIYFNAYFVISAAGSGATPITIDAPTSIYRGTRQNVAAHTESLTAGNNGSSTALAFTSGSGATFDRIRNSTNGSITGADLLLNGIITVEGWYREA